MYSVAERYYGLKCKVFEGFQPLLCEFAKVSARVSRETTTILNEGFVVAGSSNAYPASKEAETDYSGGVRYPKET